jgi:cytochrome P450
MSIAVKDNPAEMAATAAAVAEANATPLEQINPAHSKRFRDNTLWPFFERLRREDPVHYTPDSEWGRYWSITKWEDIVAVDTNYQDFSSTGGITLSTRAQREQFKKELAGRSGFNMRDAAIRGEASFIGLDEPFHGPKRKSVSPTLAPANVEVLSPLVRERAGQILDGLPIGKEFDWVDKVSKELTLMTLATLLDFPQEQRRKLLYWTSQRHDDGREQSPEERRQAQAERVAVFDEMWERKVNSPPTNDLISMMAHNDATRNMGKDEYHGNVGVLIVGGNDTTRNTISGSVYELNRNPEQYDKLRANPALIPSMMSETIRWQTPLAHMMRSATRDIELKGKLIKKGDKVVMWYISGNRDETMIENPNSYIIDRARPRQHLSFGFGVHRCVGNRVAEMQLTIIWEEILKRFPKITVLAEPQRTLSSFVHGYDTLPVVIPAHA